jgi:hypothetical protein
MENIEGLYPNKKRTGVVIDPNNGEMPLKLWAKNILQQYEEGFDQLDREFFLNRDLTLYPIYSNKLKPDLKKDWEFNPYQPDIIPKDFSPFNESHYDLIGQSSRDARRLRALKTDVVLMPRNFRFSTTSWLGCYVRTPGWTDEFGCLQQGLPKLYIYDLPVYYFDREPVPDKIKLSEKAKLWLEQAGYEDTDLYSLDILQQPMHRINKDPRDLMISEVQELNQKIKKLLFKQEAIQLKPLGEVENILREITISVIKRAYDLGGAGYYRSVDPKAMNQCSREELINAGLEGD